MRLRDTAFSVRPAKPGIKKQLCRKEKARYKPVGFTVRNSCFLI